MQPAWELLLILSAALTGQLSAAASSDSRKARLRQGCSKILWKSFLW